MLHKITILLVLLVVLLSACAQATVAPAPTAILEPTAYPAPVVEELVPLATASGSAYPSPYPLENDPLTGNNDKVKLKSGINTDFAPQSGDLALVVGPVYMEIASSETLMRTGDQPAALHLVGNVPNPCYHLRVVVQPPNAQNNLMVEVYSVADPEKMCAEMLQPFDEVIALDALAAGKYTVYINTEKLGALEVK